MDESNSSRSELNGKLENWKQWAPTEFLAVLLHELRTPILVIHGYAQTILLDEEKKELHPQAGKSILNAAETLAALCNDIAEYRRELMNKSNM